MGIRVAVFTPLPVRWPHKLIELARGIHIVDRPAFDESNWTFWNLRRTEVDVVHERTHWLRVDCDCEDGEQHSRMQRMHAEVRSAMLGFQLWAQKGWDGIVVGAVAKANGRWGVETVAFPEPYRMSEWGKMLAVEKMNPSDLAPLVQGTLKAYESESVAIINPFQFLEIGMQTAFNHPIAGSLFWTFGLDGLLGMAGGAKDFSRRLTRLLGADTVVFPQDWAGRIPNYKVAEVSDDIFLFRNQLSHGQKILEKHREKIPFKFGPKELAYLAVEDWTVTTLIVESSLFSLLMALRKVIAAGYFEQMKDHRKWTRWLDSTV